MIIAWGDGTTTQKAFEYPGYASDPSEEIEAQWLMAHESVLEGEGLAPVWLWQGLQKHGGLKYVAHVE